jgi:hypothetical protein
MHPLTILHHEIRDLIGRLAVETAKAAPDMGAITAIRMKLTAASRRRATLLEDGLVQARAVGSDDLKILEPVVSVTREARLKSGAHIGKWTLRAIEADWDGYRRDSAGLRAAMLRQLDLEAQNLDPWLRRSLPR